VRRPGEDPDLEAAFAALRRQEETAGRSFAALWAAAGERRQGRTVKPWRPLLLAGAAAAAGLLAVALALWRLPPPSAGTVPTISQWRPATDFLLQTPGRELLGEAPTLGRGLPFTPSIDPRRRPS
jgi:hypothetical protein